VAIHRTVSAATARQLMANATIEMDAKDNFATILPVNAPTLR
jgi:hypothetical protein